MSIQTDRKPRFCRILGWLSFASVLGIVIPSHGGEPFWIESVQTKEGYKVEKLTEYAFVYIDRDFVFTEVPACLQDRNYIVTANSDKFSRGPNFITIHSETPVSVYVGYDRRYRTVPAWLKEGFDRVPQLELAIGDPKLEQVQVIYDVYRATYPPGKIELGGNLSDQEESNYAMFTVIIMDESMDKCL